MLPNLLLRDMARANPTTNPPRSTMTDPNLLRKDRQDEARRQQQTDERIRELEGKVKQLREALLSLLSNSRYVLRSEEPVDPMLWQALSASISTAEDTLDGGGDSDE